VLDCGAKIPQAGYPLTATPLSVVLLMQLYAKELLVLYPKIPPEYPSINPLSEQVQFIAYEFET